MKDDIVCIVGIDDFLPSWSSLFRVPYIDSHSFSVARHNNLETVRFDVRVRNANASTSATDYEDDRLLGVILNIIAKPPDCRKPNKV